MATLRHALDAGLSISGVTKPGWGWPVICYSWEDDPGTWIEEGKGYAELRDAFRVVLPRDWMANAGALTEKRGGLVSAHISVLTHVDPVGDDGWCVRLRGLVVTGIMPTGALMRKGVTQFGIVLGGELDTIRFDYRELEKVYRHRVVQSLSELAGLAKGEDDDG